MLDTNIAFHSTFNTITKQKALFVMRILAFFLKLYLNAKHGALRTPLFLPLLQLNFYYLKNCTSDSRGFPKEIGMRRVAHAHGWNIDPLKSSKILPHSPNTLNAPKVRKIFWNPYFISWIQWNSKTNHLTLLSLYVVSFVDFSV